MSSWKSYEAIGVGQTDSLVKRITEADVRRFVEMTGDDNPLHVDATYAGTTPFKDIVVHGMLGASFLSTVIGTRLPGPGALWVSQNFEFLLPVRLGDELTISCTVLRKHDRERLLELDTRIVNQNRQVVLTGQGKVKVLQPSAARAPTGDADRALGAIVTGGGGGIGREICLALARAGHHVVVNYLGREERARETVAAIEAGGGRALAVRADVSSEEGGRALVSAASAAFGDVGVLVNAASPRVNPRALADTSWSDLATHLDVQVKAAFLLAQACAPAMAARKWGRIVNVTSQVVAGPPTPGWTGYAVGKGALATLTRYLAAELGPQGITVNAVAPGMCVTGLIGDIPEKAQLIVARQTPTRRLAHPADVAAAVAYLVSPSAGHVSGESLAVNGGLVMT